MVNGLGAAKAVRFLFMGDLNAIYGALYLLKLPVPRRFGYNLATTVSFNPASAGEGIIPTLVR